MTPLADTADGGNTGYAYGVSVGSRGWPPVDLA